jgi:limonene-1,2-epoxide hydrolase
MGVAEEQLILSFIEYWKGPTQNAEGMSSMMAEDVIWHINMPLAKAIVGREAARAEIERQNTISSGLLEGSKLLKILYDETVFTERIDINAIRGRPVTFYINGVFEIRDGQISKWRDYFDTCDMVQKNLVSLPASI